MFYGAQYYRPPFPKKDCWRRDMEHMKACGFTCVKLWAVWNWIERRPGEFQFDELDELVDLAEENGLDVIINTIPEGAPYWTFTERREENAGFWQGTEDDLYQTAEGKPVEYGGPANLPSAGWPGLCMDCPEFSELVARFIEKTAQHYAQRDCVIAIDVWNEPHLEPMYDYRDQMLCYCRHSKAEFLKWLKEKYGTLEKLNEAWYRAYTSWEQVQAPVRFGTWADMIDWRRFWLENLQRWMRIRAAAARKGAPQKAVQSHVAYSGVLGNKVTGGLANELGDEFLLAKEVDWFGLSSFPKWLMGEQHVYRHLMHNEMVAAASYGKLFYQVELQGGAGKPGLLGGEVPNARDVRLWNWNTVAAGGKGSVYWQYAPEPAGIESPGFGLTGFRGEDSERSLEAAAMARKLNLKILDRAVRVQPVNAVYVSRDTDLLTFASERREEMYAGSLSGVYRAAYDTGIPIGFFHQDNLEELCGSGIKTLYLPMTLTLSRREMQVMKKFVEEGGTLVAEACPGLYRPDGLLEQNQDFLRELFGVTHEEVQGMSGWGEVSARGVKDSACGTKEEELADFTGRFYRQAVSTCEETQVLSAFDDGKPALTQKSFGKGKAVWIGTYPAYHYEQSRLEENRRLLSRWMDASGYAPLESIEISAFHKSEGIISLAPVVRLLETEEEYALVLVNHTEQQIEVKITEKNADEPMKITLAPSDGQIYSWLKK